MEVLQLPESVWRAALLGAGCHELLRASHCDSALHALAQPLWRELALRQAAGLDELRPDGSRSPGWWCDVALRLERAADGRAPLQLLLKPVLASSTDHMHEHLGNTLVYGNSRVYWSSRSSMDGNSCETLSYALKDESSLVAFTSVNIKPFPHWGYSFAWRALRLRVGTRPTGPRGCSDTQWLTPEHVAWSCSVEKCPDSDAEQAYAIEPPAVGNIIELELVGKHSLLPDFNGYWVTLEHFKAFGVELEVSTAAAT